MPEISHKGRTMPDSPIRKLASFANGAKDRGTHVIHLNIGQPDIATPPQALEAIRGMNREVLEYSPSEGFASYRDGLSRYYATVGVAVTPEEIMVTTGGSEALVFAFMSCLNPGDQVIIPEPFYANYNGFAAWAGIEIVPVTASIENGFALPSMAAFEAAITDRTKAILICNPGNPTGTKYADESLHAVADLVKQRDLFLFADEVYREFTYDGNMSPSVLSLDGLEEHAIVIDSVSKRYSMCGARIGAMVTKNEEIRRAAMRFAMARLSPPTLAQVAAEAALETDASYFDAVRSEYRKRRDALVQGLNGIENVVCPVPGGAFYAVAKLPIDDADTFCQWILESFEFEGSTVMMAPNSGFYATPGLGKQEVRMAYVLHLDEIQKAVQCIEAALQVYPGRVVH
ncbi:pyridoxal phosphate-dependent aminotransferase [Flavobacteriales bacterium]|jgi:aspartate aminotransferase|nr:pyridoxal phosphate-dependent aminotransferase [Flavobacteriales bacterium]